MLVKYNINVTLIVISFFCVFFFSACESLPSGNPPEGVIVKITPSTNEPLTFENAINVMTAMISTSSQISSAKNPPAIGLSQIRCNNESYIPVLSNLYLGVYKNLLHMEIIDSTFGAEADYIMFTQFTLENTMFFPKQNSPFQICEWELKLLDPKKRDKIVWSYTLKVKVGMGLKK